MGAIHCLENLSVDDAEERVEWFCTSVLDPEDILALANANFLKCDVCGDSYRMSGVDDELLRKYCVSREGGWTFTSASGNDIRICEKCLTTNRVVELFTS